MWKCAAILLAAAATASAGSWETDWDQARGRARRENKQILINLTGSDWCSWCIKLKKRVFEHEGFLAYAEKHLVLMEADFPRFAKQPPELAAQNKRLRELYLTRGYPTVYLLDAGGNKLSEDLGEMAGGIDVWIRKLDALRAAHRAGK
jgi:protein disulfide-isomerase